MKIGSAVAWTISPSLSIGFSLLSTYERVELETVDAASMATVLRADFSGLFATHVLGMRWAPSALTLGVSVKFPAIRRYRGTIDAIYTDGSEPIHRVGYDALTLSGGIELSTGRWYPYAEYAFARNADGRFTAREGLKVADAATNLRNSRQMAAGLRRKLGPARSWGAGLGYSQASIGPGDWNGTAGARFGDLEALDRFGIGVNYQETWRPFSVEFGAAYYRGQANVETGLPGQGLYELDTLIFSTSAAR